MKTIQLKMVIAKLKCNCNSIIEKALEIFACIYNTHLIVNWYKLSGTMIIFNIIISHINDPCHGLIIHDQHESTKRNIKHIDHHHGSSIPHHCMFCLKEYSIKDNECFTRRVIKIEQGIWVQPGQIFAEVCLFSGYFWMFVYKFLWFCVK